ncbi:MAG: hypothetical protein OHK0039_38210 [Bacteroidia bacterium]
MLLVATACRPEAPSQPPKPALATEVISDSLLKRLNQIRTIASPDQQLAELIDFNEEARAQGQYMLYLNGVRIAIGYLGLTNRHDQAIHYGESHLRAPGLPIADPSYLMGIHALATTYGELGLMQSSIRVLDEGLSILAQWDDSLRRAQQPVYNQLYYIYTMAQMAQGIFTGRHTQTDARGRAYLAWLCEQDTFPLPLLSSLPDAVKNQYCQASVLNNLGENHRAAGDNAAATACYDSVLTIYESLRRDSLFVESQLYIGVFKDIGNAWYNRSLLAFKQQQWTAAAAYAQSARAMYSHRDNQLHSNLDLGCALLLESEAAYGQGLYVQGVSLARQALATMCNRPTAQAIALDDMPLNLYSLWAVHAQARGLRAAGMSPAAVLPAYLLADSLIGALRGSIYAEDDGGLSLSDTAGVVYAGAVRSAWEAGDTSLAFYFAEMAQAGWLREGIRRGAVGRFVGVPDSLLLAERSQARALRAAREAWRETRMPAAVPDSDQRQALAALAQARQAWDKLLAQLERDHPAYFDLKYRPIRPDHHTLRKALLVPGEAILSCNETPDAIYSFLLTTDTLLGYRHAKPPGYRADIDQVKAVLYPSQPDTLPGTAAHRRYTEAGYRLYRLLLEQPFDHLRAQGGHWHVQVVSNGPLSQLALGALLSDSIPASLPGEAYHRWPYVERLPGFTLSTSLGLSSRVTAARVARPRPTDEIGFFVPAYTHPGDDLGDLARQMQQLARQVGGKAFAGRQVTESLVRQESGRFRLLALTLHGKADTYDPFRSYLYFDTTQTDGPEDNRLFASEVYALPLAAELIITNACETARGTYVAGEGELGVGRAFAYAGVPALILSQWRIYQEKTALINRYFFEAWRDTTRIDVALQAAKLRYLDAPEMAGKAASPRHWAGLQAVGQMRGIAPPATTPPTRTLVTGLLAAGLAALALAGWWSRRSRRD